MNLQIYFIKFLSLLNNVEDIRTLLQASATPFLAGYVFLEAKKNVEQYQDLISYINNAVEKYNSEVDFVEILKAIRQLKVVTSLVLTEQQLALSSFSKDTLVITEPSHKELRVYNYLERLKLSNPV